ncbi:hypothetical protein J3458_021962 [Metarhizium acridum]|uniref:uncharacterized protein n=1 Tax=Metarhizium acridum TaxID=92637 RepID=UPI001C6B5E7D|nr:hypothetical protein J3458_021962 [Metarhizium acridum]
MGAGLYTSPLLCRIFSPLSLFYTNPPAIDHGQARVCKLPHRKANRRAVSPGPPQCRRGRGVLASGTKEDHPAHVGSITVSPRAEFLFLPRQRLMESSDFRLVTVLACLYVISLVDRVNISTAALAHLNSDLALQTGARYSIVISAFFITYTLFQPLGTVLTRKIGPRLFLSSIAMAWGLVMIGNGFVDSWQTLAGLRVLVG